MKKYFIIILSSIFIYSCGSTLPSTGEVKKSSENIDTLTLSTKGYGKSEDEAKKHAKTQAFSNLLFRGISNSSYSKAMVGNEDEARKLHKGFFKNFFNKMDLNKFITDINVTKNYNKKDRSITCDITINIKSLRAHLIDSKILREWGLN
ncbi:MAG: hypothetical protein VXY26_01290 [Bacteroidota bacterium]|nr:hypothetical protein [Bacteroidota bacterium]